MPNSFTKASTSVITVQSGNPTAITEFDTISFIYGTSDNRLYYKVNANTIAYIETQAISEVSMLFSIDDVTMTTSAGGGSEHSNVTLVGDATDMYAKIALNNWDGTLDGAPTLSYRLSGVQFITSTSHMSATDVISDTAVECAITTSESDTSDDSGMSRNLASGEYITVHATVIEGTTTYTQESERYYFLNGMIWGSCAATTGPTAAEFLECFEPDGEDPEQGGLDNANGKGYTLPSNTGGTFSNSRYHSDFGARQINSDTSPSTEYIFFGWPDQGGTATTIKAPNGDDISGDFRAVQTVGSTSTYPNLEGYQEVYNIYVSDNLGVNLEVTVT